MDRNGFEGISWGYAIPHDMVLVKIIQHFLGSFGEYFLRKYFKSLKYLKRGFEGFDQYFEHDHVLKPLYMDNICPLSFPSFSKYF